MEDNVDVNINDSITIMDLSQGLALLAAVIYASANKIPDEDYVFAIANRFQEWIEAN